MRKKIGARSVRWSMGGVALVALLVTLLVISCGEQDLYSPPTSPFEIVGRVQLPSENYGVAVLGDYAYVAGGQAGLHVVDISDPSNPVLASTHDTHKRADAVRVVASPQPDGSHLHIAYVVEGTEGLMTYNVTDPDSVTEFDAGSTAVDGKGLFIPPVDDPNEIFYLYLAESWKGLRVFRSVLGEPGKVDYFGVFNYTNGYAQAVQVVDGFAYVADDEMGLTVMDVRVLAPGQVQQVANCDTDGNARDIVVQDGYAYMSSGSGGLQILQVDGGETPVLISSLTLNGDSDAIEVRDGTAFVAADDGGLHVIDVRNPQAPVLLGSVLTPDAHDVALAKDGLAVIADEGGDLIIFRGPRAFEDAEAPGAVFNLSSPAHTATCVELVWGAPGDDGFIGLASEYDVRYHTGPITVDNWDSATLCMGEPLPSTVGKPDSLIISGLTPGTTYHFALKTADAVPLWSDLSNVVTTTTATGITLTKGSVAPLAVQPGSTVTYQVTYGHPQGEAPATYQVVIDGVPYDMTQLSDDYFCGAVFEYSTVLEVGVHAYHFSFADAQGSSLQSEGADGPYFGLILEMGSPLTELGRDDDETQHIVAIPDEFYVAATEVTQSSFDSLMGYNPSYFQGGDWPVERVTWFEAIQYCNALSLSEGYTPCYDIDSSQVLWEVTWDREAIGYRLPTEAEWEYACRAGTETAFFTGDIAEETCGIDASLNLAGWYCGNADSSTHEVGEKQANGFGCHDMHGNVWEWCWDYYGPYETGAVYDPTGPEFGTHRVIRGGSWYYFARECRSASREMRSPTSADDFVGFRVVRNAD
jgi:formylglycine-generating enzyme required for sulfatase activity